MGRLASALDARQLELPLVFEPQPVARPAPPSPAGDEPPVDYEPQADWSPEAEVVLHGVLLERSLKGLSCKNNAEGRRDVLRWIFKPDVTYFSVSGRRLARHQDDVPFSFRRCCRLAGYDADALRDTLRLLLERRVIQVSDVEVPGMKVPGIELS